MMTKQAELKKQAYASKLKSRALSVLIYLIDRSNKELTCFPAIPTMAEQLHISASTVKRALHELLDAGYIKKEARFREKNKGQTSNLYTLVLFEGQPIPDDSQDVDSNSNVRFDSSEGASQEKKEKAEQEMCQVKHIIFDTLKKQKEVSEVQLEVQMEGLQENAEGTVREEDHQETRQERKVHGVDTSARTIKRYFTVEYERGDFSFICQEEEQLIQRAFSGRQNKFLLYLWTGEGFSLMPP